MDLIAVVCFGVAMVLGMVLIALRAVEISRGISAFRKQRGVDGEIARERLRSSGGTSE
jgi:hypothetical protein